MTTIDRTDAPDAVFEQRLAEIEAAAFAPEAYNPTVHGIRPHRLITAEEDAQLRAAAESMPPIGRDEMLRQIGLLP